MTDRTPEGHDATVETIRIEFPPALMTRDVAAYYLGRSTRELDRLREKGHITARKFRPDSPDGSAPYYAKEDLDEFVASLPENHRERA
ncbi:hypothetical protein [Microbacterium sp. SS28]|uniref:hypothetical protein n=1 Tax=Microbacterium sp. SS28 TaxID=2919948 RepID=UPI001FAAF89F|nr:hypothetical protein [Microbacterium sp. SS28]